MFLKFHNKSNWTRERIKDQYTIVFGNRFQGAVEPAVGTTIDHMDIFIVPGKDDRTMYDQLDYIISKSTDIVAVSYEETIINNNLSNIREINPELVDYYNSLPIEEAAIKLSSCARVLLVDDGSNSGTIQIRILFRD